MKEEMWQFFDVPAAYLNTETPREKLIIPKIEGEFMDIMCEVNTEQKICTYRKCHVKVLYLRLLKALYGCMESALLWYDLYTKKLN